MPAPWWVAVAGLLALAAAMGIGRFAYTALLPQMRESGLVSLGQGGVLAASNYLGYLIGALWAAFSRQANAPRRLLLGLLVSVVTTLAMSLPLGTGAWNGIRLVSGIASAFVYVYATGIVLRYLGAVRAVGWSALHYVGVGVGISLSAWGAQWMLASGDALTGWAVLGAVAAVVGALAAVVLARADRGAAALAASAMASNAPAAAGRHEARASTAPPLPWLAASYGLAGFGYIVNATFLPLMLRGQSGMADSALVGWLLVGLAAIPATAIWVRAGLRWGTYPALMACTALQAFGVALPVLAQGQLAAMSGAVLLGATFMGIAGLAQWLARTPDAQTTARRIGLMTACYGAGQIVGPLLAAWLATDDDFTVPVLLAALALLLSLCCIEVSRRRERLDRPHHQA